jgi:hypothetical protein
LLQQLVVPAQTLLLLLFLGWVVLSGSHGIDLRSKVVTSHPSYPLHPACKAEPIPL